MNATEAIHYLDDLYTELEDSQTDSIGVSEEYQIIESAYNFISKKDKINLHYAKYNDILST